MGKEKMLQIFTISPLFLLVICVYGWGCLPVHATPEARSPLATATVKTQKPSTFLLSQTMMSSSPAALPDAIANAVKKDLAKRTNLAVKQIQVTSAVQKTWPDGCLGLAKPEQMCSQAMVPGWLITLTNGKKYWTYRTDNSGRNIRLQS